MTKVILTKAELLAQLSNYATEAQKIHNELREARNDNRRLRTYEYDCEMAAQFIASKGLKDEYNKFVLKRQSASRPKLRLVGDE